jgi:hypothetical protein
LDYYIRTVTTALHALAWEALKKNKKINYNLRDISSGLSLPKPRTNNMKNSFMYDGAHLWNSIPKEIRESRSLSSFQNKIAAHINEYKVN